MSRCGVEVMTAQQSFVDCGDGRLSRLNGGVVAQAVAHAPSTNGAKPALASPRIFIDVPVKTLPAPYSPYEKSEIRLAPNRGHLVPFGLLKILAGLRRKDSINRLKPLVTT
jgi:hypothetical protein